MRIPKGSSHRRSFLVLGTVLMFAAPTVACSGDLESAPDPRVGQEKRVRFLSGCTNSVTMPVGATAPVTLETADSKTPLPSDLEPKSSDATVIEVTPTNPTAFKMRALKQGQSNIEVWSAGARYDWLTFKVEPAKAVKFTSEPAILAGGRTGLAVTDIFGACGTDKCPLFGHTFVKWSADPVGSFTFLEDTENLAHYTASTTPGKGAILGLEPSTNGELVRHSVEIVDPATITGISGTLTPPRPEGSETDPDPVPFPASLPANQWFSVRVFGERSGKTHVAISRHDIVWTVPAEINLIPQTEPADPFEEVFAASGTTGSFTLTAKVALLGGMEQQFVVMVTPQ